MALRGAQGFVRAFAGYDGGSIPAAFARKPLWVWRRLSSALGNVRLRSAASVKRNGGRGLVPFAGNLSLLAALGAGAMKTSNAARASADGGRPSDGSRRTHGLLADINKGLAVGYLLPTVSSAVSLRRFVTKVRTFAIYAGQKFVVADYLPLKGCVTVRAIRWRKSVASNVAVCFLGFGPASIAQNTASLSPILEPRLSVERFEAFGKVLSGFTMYGLLRRANAGCVVRMHIVCLG